MQYENSERVVSSVPKTLIQRAMCRGIGGARLFQQRPGLGLFF